MKNTIWILTAIQTSTLLSSSFFRLEEQFVLVVSTLGARFSRTEAEIFTERLNICQKVLILRSSSWSSQFSYIALWITGTLLSIHSPGRVTPWFQATSNLRTGQLVLHYRITSDKKLHQNSWALQQQQSVPTHKTARGNCVPAYETKRGNCWTELNCNTLYKGRI